MKQTLKNKYVNKHIHVDICKLSKTFHKEVTLINTTIKNEAFVFHTSSTLFSPDQIDKGTLAMLLFVEFTSTDKVLDLGCGYGVVGIVAAKLIGSRNVVMSDIQEKAVQISHQNTLLNDVADIQIIRSDGFTNIPEKDFSLILSNPLYHSDFSVPKHFIEKGFNRLRIGGKMMMVVKRKDWYKKKFIAIFGGVVIQEIDGYYVFRAEKRSITYANWKA